MINVTDEAREVLTATLDSSGAEGEQALRLARGDQGQFGLTLDSEREGDQVIKQADRAVLLIDEQVAESLDGATLEAVESPDGAQLALRAAEGEPQQ